MIRQKTCVWLAGFFSAAAVIGIQGCGEEKGETVYKQEDQEVTVKDKGDSVSVTVKTNEGTGQYTSGAAATIPKDFPKDVPTYPDMSVEFSGKQGNMFTISGRTSDALEKVSASLKSSVVENGWAETLSMNQAAAGGQPGIMMSYMKEERVLNLVLAADQGGTAINIMTGQQ